MQILFFNFRCKNCQQNLEYVNKKKVYLNTKLFQNFVSVKKVKFKKLEKLIVLIVFFKSKILSRI